jgi:MFS family permease
VSSDFKPWLQRANPVVFTAVAGLAGFCAYFSMYAFRKPFSAATYDHVAGWTFALDFKIALVLAQVAGYALSKMIGIRVIAEMSPARRGMTILGLIGASWLALILFPLIPAPWNVAMLFFNGLPLGMIWGLVFSYMEGRRTSEVLGAILCASFILSSGVVKSVGKWLMESGHVSAFWMPAATGAIFIPLLLVSVWLLGQLPPPNAQDEAERTPRKPMSASERAAFLAIYGLGVGLLVGSYVLLTAFRDFRDNFAAEIWTALGFGEASTVFTASEAPVAVAALLVMAGLMAVKDNLKALIAMHLVILAGFLLLGVSTLAFQAHMLSPLAWMIASGAGLYMAYTPFNAMLFDRMIAYGGQAGNAGFLIYIADASGYLGSAALLVYRNFFAADLDWLHFFIASAYATCAVGAVLVSLAAVFFLLRARALQPPKGAEQRLAGTS